MRRVFGLLDEAAGGVVLRVAVGGQPGGIDAAQIARDLCQQCADGRLGLGPVPVVGVKVNGGGGGGGGGPSVTTGFGAADGGVAGRDC